MALLTACSGTEELRDPSERTLEYLQSLDKETLQTLDTDSDGLNDWAEMNEHDTNPLEADTDGDGLNDGEEINEYNTDPNTADSDEDGLSDGEEVNSHNTDPNNSDSDDDGLSDGEEINEYRTDPNSADSDGDGINDYDEINEHNSDPNNSDSDGDGFTDSQELDMGTSLNDSSDPAYLKEGALGTVNFAFDKSNIDEEAAKILSENIKKLMDSKKFRVRIDAYTDHVGGDQYNLRLSKRRAEAVTQFYIENGVAESRIESRGLGKAPQPCMDMTDEIGCRKNRRAESHPLNPYQYSPNN
ncbi:OmpA family protein [Aliifodinibius halophilus]|uniref:OmpA family protein n=2 Tax=Fodinibius halophilus TaxID=1736908 RepID=A0A6M1T726_9BACT|nr:OmpA family protein [Fodinibius halophilus]